MPGTQRIHMALTVDGASLEAAVDLPTGPVPRRAVLPVLQQLTDTVVRVAENSASAAGQKISCRKGCDACCRQMVPISPTEAYGLAAALNALSPARAAGMLERFDKAIEAIEDAGLLGRLTNRYTLSPEGLKQLDRDYFAAQIPCPFLEKRACSIHPQRPLACREFLVTSAARHCRNPGSGKVQQVPMPAKVSVALLSEDKARWLPLPFARHFVAGNPEGKIKSAAAALRKILQAL